jgi:tRNA threonylcarbamoyl adenosine modification protein (Sua5/YciO/YrdC/YwlC family)
MSEWFDTSDPEQRAKGLEAAEAALRRGELVVFPTDTVYGAAADAFDPAAVAALLEAKGRGRHMPPPVLVGSVRAATALVEDLDESGKDLIEEFWPGGLTLVCRASPTLVWDLGDTKGTVAVRMPLHPLALELLKQTGPLAVSSANLSGHPAATTARGAQEQLGARVAVYLDGGPCSDVPSTIIDLTGQVPRLLRDGAISVDRLREVVPVATEEDDGSGDPQEIFVPEGGAEALEGNTAAEGDPGDAGEGAAVAEAGAAGEGDVAAEVRESDAPAGGEGQGDGAGENKGSGDRPGESGVSGQSGALE